MHLIWNPEYGEAGTLKFPSKLLHQTFRITHPGYAVAIFAGNRVVCHSSSLCKILKTSPGEFVEDVDSALRGFISYGDVPFFDERFRKESRDLMFATLDPDPEYPFLRLVWIPFDQGADCLLVLLEKDKEAALPSATEVGTFAEILKGLFRERDCDMSMNHYVMSLSPFFSDAIQDNHEFIRPDRVRIGQTLRIVERIYLGSFVRKERFIDEGEFLPPSRLEVISHGKMSLLSEGLRDTHTLTTTLLKTRIRMGLFIGGLLPVGTLNVAGLQYQKMKPANLGEAIKKAGSEAAAFSYISDGFSIFRHWNRTYSAFSLDREEDVVSLLASSSSSVVSIPLTSFSDHAPAIRKRIRSNDVLLVDRTGNEGLVLLRDCPDCLTAKRTVYKDLLSKRIPVGEPVQINREFLPSPVPA